MPNNSNFDSTETVVPADELKYFTKQVFINSGLQKNHAKQLADALVTANLRGVDSHGVVRLDPYVRNIENGGFNPEPNVNIQQVSDSGFMVNADDGPGQIGTMAAMEAVIERAVETGVSFAGVMNSNHFGTAAYYTQQAADMDCIGFAMTNVGPNVIPYGGIEPYFGTNPLGYSIPTKNSFTITLDMATSVVAKGKIHVAEEENESIPDHWAIDDQGQPTTTPEDVHALRPVGGAKGYGLGLLVDVCSGLLTGMGPSPAVDSLYDDYTNPQRIGHFVGAIDVGTFRDIDDFTADVDRLIDDLKAIPTEDGVDEVKIPGEIEAEIREYRSHHGIPLGKGTLATLEDVGRRHGVEPIW